MLNLPAPPYTLATRQLECISCKEVFAIAEDDAVRRRHRSERWRALSDPQSDTYEESWNPDQRVFVNCPRCGTDNRNWLHLTTSLSRSSVLTYLKEFPFVITGFLVMVVILATIFFLYFDPSEPRRSLILLIAVYLAGLLPLLLIPPQWKRLREHIYLRRVVASPPILDISPPARTGIVLFIIFVFLVPFVLFVLIPWTFDYGIKLLAPEDETELIQRIDEVSLELPTAIDSVPTSQREPIRNAIADLEAIVDDQRSTCGTQVDAMIARLQFLLVANTNEYREALVKDASERLRILGDSNQPKCPPELVEIAVSSLELLRAFEESLCQPQTGINSLLPECYTFLVEGMISNLSRLQEPSEPQMSDPLDRADIVLGQVRQLAQEPVGAVTRERIEVQVSTLERFIEPEGTSWFNIGTDFLRNWVWFVGLANFASLVLALFAVDGYARRMDSILPRPVFIRIAAMMRSAVWEAQNSLRTPSNINRVQWVKVERNAQGGIDMAGLYRDLPESNGNGTRISSKVNGQLYTIKTDVWGRIETLNIQDIRVPRLSYMSDVPVDSSSFQEVNTRARLARLSYMLYERLSEVELRRLSSDLDIDYQDLDATGTRDKARELVLHANRRGRLPVLLEALNQASPHANWGETIADTTVQPAEETRQLLRRFTDVRFPEQCKIYEPVRLSVQLTLAPVQAQTDIPSWIPRPLSASELSIQPTSREVEERKVELTVFISAINFEIDTRWQNLSVSLDRDSEKIEFELIGQRLGTQIIEVELFHSTVRVGYVVIETEVVEGDTLGQDAQVVYEPVHEQIWTDTRERPEIKIFVHWQENKGLDYWITESNGGSWPRDGGSISMESGEETIIEFWTDLCDLLRECVQLSGLKEDQLKSVWMNIESLGQDLCSKLLPREIQHYASIWPAGSTVLIATNEKWIPWELIHASGEFWGNKFVVARIPKIADPGAFSVSDTAAERGTSTQLRKVVHVIGGKLRPSQVVERIRTMFTQYASNIPLEAVERATLAEVHRSVAGADLIHFTCHGHIKPRPCLQLADDLSLMRCLTTSNLQKLPALTNSFIFANACSSANITSFLGELRSFAWEFYRKGAAVSIGTLGVVPTEYAVAFAERFYERLLNGYTVGESLRYAKSTAERDNPFWLLYTLYGDPFAKKHF